MGKAGDLKEPNTVGDRKGKLSSSYPPIFRAKPGESYKEWRRSVDFWLGGEGNAIPAELIGPLALWSNFVIVLDNLCITSPMRT
jgi:hypothetical protein